MERLLEKSREYEELPKYLMLENVKNLVGKKFKPQFEEWILRLDELGYNTYWQVLNVKNYGIPQNRERVFGISIRKDIDMGYVFPEPFELKTRLKDILEDEVDEKFYINNDRMNVLLKNLETSKLQKDSTVIEPVIAASRGRNPNNPSDRTPGSPTEQRLEINQNGTSNTITTVQKDNYVLEPNTIIDDTQGFDGPRLYEQNAPTLKSQRSGLKKVDENYRIRKLTPKECWRLMGFTDEEFQKAQDAGVSNSQLYKQAGNSIVVDVLEYIFRNLLK